MAHWAKNSPAESVDFVGMKGVDMKAARLSLSHTHTRLPLPSTKMNKVSSHQTTTWLEAMSLGCVRREGARAAGGGLRHQHF
jgi:hypothetical protein